MSKQNRIKYFNIFMKMYGVIAPEKYAFAFCWAIIGLMFLMGNYSEPDESESTLEERVSTVESLRDIQGEDVKLIQSDYNYGLYNGLELAVATMREVPPTYKGRWEDEINGKIQEEAGRY